MTKILFRIILSAALINQTACLQEAEDANSCYSEKFTAKEMVFTKLLDKPHFKGGHDSLVTFLSRNIDEEQIIENLHRNNRTYTDTARVKFIVNQQGGISQLSIQTT